MAGQDDDTEKSFEPTPRKLQEARKKGDVPRSQDLNATAAYFGLFLALLVAVGGALAEGATGMLVFLDQPHDLAELFFEGSAIAPTGQALSQSLPLLAILFGFPILCVLLSAIAQQSITFAPSKLEPKLSRISPVSVAKQKFGTAGLFEWFKSFLKLIIFSVCLAVFIFVEIERIIVTPKLEAKISLSYLGNLILSFLGIVIIVSAVIGAVDFFFQRFEHHRKLRMSRKEVQDEAKEAEGDPFLKQERMQRGRERAMAQSIKDVETADVVITNPTHFAVALHWSREAGSAPVCVAKGADEIARAIRERAFEHNVPLHSDPPTARALFSSTEIGQEIPTELYGAVAAAINFAENMRQRAKERGY